ncbi:hypothetical protein [Empedobacter sp. 189-2]|uniref:hypothetical protein n=1 Tax=Empedobacter sp. 189-2 TaxID=2746724 RepID=UPI00257524D5|nr:hypothetical protein [Empedobacter sp. 189-2]MDM1542348.1 hypothetical protein [Empedobacter sp. 189-2]
MTRIQGEIELIKNPNYDRESEIDDMGYLEWALENREERDKVYKKILVKEEILERLEIKLQRETHPQVTEYLDKKIKEVELQLEDLRAESKQLLNKFFGN